MNPINKDITMCVPRLQQAWAHAQEQYALLRPNAPKLILVETYRSPEVQRAYYAQGRQTLAEVNKLRKAVGLEKISEAENKYIITRALPGKSKHQVSPSKAFDIGFVKDGKLDFSDENYLCVAKIIRGLYPDVTWGADWNRNWKTSDEKLVDMPHFEVA